MSCDPQMIQERRKRDLCDLAGFGACTGRRWLVRDALLAIRRKGLMTPELAHIVPTTILEDPTPYITEALRGDVCWIVADAYDALRLESYGFPVLAIEDKTALTLADLSGCRWVILLQCPGEKQTMAGLDVRGELLGLGWTGTLTTTELPYADLHQAEQECGGERFATFLVTLLLHAKSQQLAGERSHSMNGGDHHGLRTVGVEEVSSWRR
jgi:hypothetical protein